MKEARYQAIILREDAEREAGAIAVVVVRPFGDSDRSFLAGRKKYRLENPDQILVRLKVKHSRFNTLYKQRLGFKFVRQKLQRYRKWVEA